MKLLIKTLLLTLFLTHISHAAVIIVDNNQDLGELDGNCDLRDAINSANINISIDNCAAGDSGVQDLIIVQVTGPIQLQSTLPVFSSVLITTTINADPVEVIAAANQRVMRVIPNSVNDNDFAITNFTFSNGNALGTASGGGIYFSGTNAKLGVIELNGMTFSNNQGYEGGAVHFDETYAESILINNNTYINNTATVSGGAIASLRGVDSSSEDGSFRILRSHFEGNSADSGGALLLLEEAVETAEISNSQFMGNQAINNGGAVMLGAVIQSQNFFTDRNLYMYNSAGDSGGGLVTSFSSIVYARDSLFAFNNAARGGAVTSLVDDALLRLSNSTLVHNSASTSGDNIYIFGTGRIIPSRNIIAHPANGNNCTGTLGTTPPANTKDNLTDDNTCELLNSLTNTIVADPLLTGFATRDEWFPGFMPTSDSPALDRTDLCGSKDVMERPRPTDGDGNGSAICDIGGIEAPADLDLIWSDAFGL